MNDIQKYDLYAKFLNTQPVNVARKDSQEIKFYRIEIEYNINNQVLFINAFVDKKEKPNVIDYGATLNDSKGKRIAYFYNPFFAKKLYEYGQKYL